MKTPNPLDYDFEEGFTDPFRYVPHPSVRTAAEIVIKRIQELDPDVRAGFEEGKMMGVLVVRVPDEISDFSDWLDEDRRIGFLAGYSGAVSGMSIIEGFAPPVYDLFDPDGEYRRREAEISALNARISKLGHAGSLISLKTELSEAERCRDEEIGLMKVKMTISKRERDLIRSEMSDSTQTASLIRESQFEKAELRRLKLSWEERIGEIRERLDLQLAEITDLKTKRSVMSDTLQKWIFEQYIVYNASGGKTSVWELFSGQGLIPPGGTGDCAAPKLLNHAYRMGLLPLAMGEFWYGKNTDTAVRCHGHFYPSCTSKCGPLLSYMLQGLTTSAAGIGLKGNGSPCDCERSSKDGKEFASPSSSHHESQPHTIYEDSEIAVVEKPSGMPSVPGLDGRESVLEWLNSSERQNVFDRSVYEAVHRLDMDTSGVMVFAKTPEAAVNLRRQFEEHSVKKTYMARLCPDIINGFQDKERKVSLKTGCKGRVELPLNADYDERPRQKADHAQGKPAITEFEVIKERLDGCIDIIFHPVTGRTHQLRVHSAHSLGLGRPIVGDLLYGGYSTKWPDEDSDNFRRLHLHALGITFRHPHTDEELSFTSAEQAYIQ